MPFLSILFEKRKYFNPFSANGIIALLELMIESDHILNFVLSLPAPSNQSPIQPTFIKHT